jgi:hypothetical protein
MADVNNTNYSSVAPNQISLLICCDAADMTSSSIDCPRSYYLWPDFVARGYENISRTPINDSSNYARQGIFYERVGRFKTGADGSGDDARHGRPSTATWTWLKESEHRIQDNRTIVDEMSIRWEGETQVWLKAKLKNIYYDGVTKFVGCCTKCLKIGPIK